MGNCKNIAVILAGGSGCRMGDNLPKQFHKINGKTIIEYTIDVFEENSGIDEIAVVVNANYIDYFEDIAHKNSWAKLQKIIAGGEERHFSVFAAISAYTEFPNYNLLFHDAVRPLVSSRIIDDVVAALDCYKAVGVAFPTSDTIIETDELGKFVKSVPNRKYLQKSQTPQAFKQHIIAEAYSKALNDSSFISTDDCGVVVRYMPHIDIFVVKGDVDNFKITYTTDLLLFDRLIGSKLQ